MREARAGATMRGARAGALPVALALLLLPVAAAAQEGAGGDSRTEVGGGVYLYHYAPLDLEEVDDHTEIYAAYVDVDHATGPWSFHVQGRWRDTKLREFYPSTTWIQEAWAAVRLPLGGGPGPAAGGGGAGGARPPGADGRPASLTLRAGKIYTRLGRFWDGSFIGNVHYFDGLKLDPDFGAEAVLELPAGAATVEARGQYLLDDDRINGSLPGRDLEGIASGKETGGPVGALHVSVPLLGPAPAEAGGGDRVTLRAGVSGMIERGTVGGETGVGGGAARELELEHLAADVELAAWGHRAYVEFTNRGAEGVPASTAAGPAGSTADYWLAGVRLDFPPVHLRYNYSRAEYAAAGFDERIHQPGVTVDLARRLHAMVEYDGWVRASPGAESLRLDRSLNLVILAEL